MPYQQPCCYNNYLCCALIFASDILDIHVMPYQWPCCHNNYLCCANFIAIIIIFVVLRFSWHYHFLMPSTGPCPSFHFSDLFIVLNSWFSLHFVTNPDLGFGCYLSGKFVTPIIPNIPPPLTSHHLSTTPHPPPSGMGWCQVGGTHHPPFTIHHPHLLSFQPKQLEDPFAFGEKNRIILACVQLSHTF